MQLLHMKLPLKIYTKDFAAKNAIFRSSKSANVVKNFDDKSRIGDCCECQTFHMQVVLVYLEWFRRNSLLKCALQPKIAKKIH